MKTTYKKTADRVRTTLRKWTDAAELYAARAAAEQTAEQTARAAQAAYFTAVNAMTGKAAAESAEHIDRLLTAAEHAADAAAAREAAELYAAEKRVSANSAETIARIKAAAERAEKAKAARKARAEKRAAQDAAARAKVDAVHGGKMPNVTPPPEQTAAVDETARAEHVAHLQAAAAAADIQTEKRREQWARAIRAAQVAYTYVNMPAQDAAAVAVYVTLKHIRRRANVSAAAVKQAEQWARELTAARAAEHDRAALTARIQAAAAREQTAADAAARIKDAAARDDKTAQAAAEHAAAPYESAARYYHAARMDAQKRYDSLCAEQFGFGADLWNCAAAAIADFSARGLSVADIDFSPTGRPFCVWTRIASTVQQYIRAQKTAPSTPKAGNVTVNAKGSDRPRKGHDAEHAAARAELSGKLSAALATLSPRDYEILTDRAAGISAAVLADRYGLTVQHVTRLYRAAVVAVRAAITD